MTLSLIDTHTPDTTFTKIRLHNAQSCCPYTLPNSSSLILEPPKASLNDDQSLIRKLGNVDAPTPSQLEAAPDNRKLA